MPRNILIVSKKFHSTLFQFHAGFFIMEVTSLADLGMDDPLFFHQYWPVNYLEGHGSGSAASLFYEAESSQAGADMPLKQFITTAWDSCNSNSPSSNTAHFLNSNFTKMPCQGSKRLKTNTSIAQANDHILAERKRREKITQRFIALSALVPGLKKMDKVSVLGDAIKYMKQLQEKVKILEEQNKKKSMESLVYIQKHKVYGDGENSNSVTEQLPIIEARFCNKDVLIIIHCEKRKGVLENAVVEIEKLHLYVVNSCVMTFADSTLNITILAQQKDEESTMNKMELVKNLRGSLEIIM